jgi:TRAP-type C4-dicarboxylate transport system permease small subunit
VLVESIYKVPGEKAARVLAILGFVVLVIMAIWILIDVFSGIFRLGFPGMVQWVEVLNVICIALPLPFVTIQRKHIYMTIIQKNLSDKQQRILDIIVFFIVLLFSAILAWRVTVEALYSLKYWESSDVGITVYWFPGKVGLAIGFILMALVVICQIISAIRGKVEENGSGG